VPNGATNNYKNVVNEWKISTTNANVVDPASRREVISFGKNAGNHNGGTITFGPDGYAYLALGDGGNANDVGASHIVPGGNAQNLITPLGKMLRFDPLNPALNPSSPDPVSTNGQYRIPTTNPFQAAGQVPEIYAYGLRNPYRFCFDPVTGDLIEADVGQNNIEEINRIIRGGNYGWAIKEGDFLFNMTNGPSGPAGTIGAPPGNRSLGVPAGLIDPISGPMGTLEYDHNNGISITGGFVYRGAGMPELYGKYIFWRLALIAAPCGRTADSSTPTCSLVRSTCLRCRSLARRFCRAASPCMASARTLMASSTRWRPTPRPMGPAGSLQALLRAPDVPGVGQPAGHLLARCGWAPARADQQSGCWHWHELGHHARFDDDQSCRCSNWPGQRQRVLPAGLSVIL